MLKYLNSPEPLTAQPRPLRGSRLDPYTNYIDHRVSEGLENCRVLLREIRGMGYEGSYSTVADYVRPRRRRRQPQATVRFETAAGEQAQVDWGSFSYVDEKGRPHLLNGAAPARSRIATGSALRATAVFRRFARLGLAVCANEWHLNAAPHILRELYRQLQARRSPPGVHDTRATARATGHGSKDTATAQRPSSPTSGALPARGQHAQSPWSGPRAEDSLRVAKTSNRRCYAPGRTKGRCGGRPSP